MVDGNTEMKTESEVKIEQENPEGVEQTTEKDETPKIGLYQTLLDFLTSEKGTKFCYHKIVQGHNSKIQGVVNGYSVNMPEPPRPGQFQQKRGPGGSVGRNKYNFALRILKGIFNCLTFEDRNDEEKVQQALEYICDWDAQADILRLVPNSSFKILSAVPNKVHVAFYQNDELKTEATESTPLLAMHVAAVAALNSDDYNQVYYKWVRSNRKVRFDILQQEYGPKSREFERFGKGAPTGPRNIFTTFFIDEETNEAVTKININGRGDDVEEAAKDLTEKSLNRFARVGQREERGVIGQRPGQKRPMGGRMQMSMEKNVVQMLHEHAQKAGGKIEWTDGDYGKGKPLRFYCSATLDGFSVTGPPAVTKKDAKAAARSCSIICKISKT